MSTRHKVIVTDFIADALEPERGILGDIADIIALGATDESELAGQVEDAAALMLYHAIPRLSARTIDRLAACRVIARCGVGYDNVDLAAARRCGIPVVNVPDYGTEEVADSAIGMILALTRGIHELNSRTRAATGDWKYLQAAPLYRLRGRTLGILGLGRIGSATALRGKVLGLRVVFYDPYIADGYDKALGVTRCETFEELLAAADIVSIHTPLTDETRHMIDAESIAQMKRGAYLVNTARGAIVDTAAVAPALASGHLAGAALDVLEVEPPPADHPLIRAWRDPDHPAHHRLILNPHAAFYCEEGLTEMRLKGAHACRRALLGQPPRNVVNGLTEPRRITRTARV
jgi:C-terminal binding protein